MAILPKNYQPDNDQVNKCSQYRAANMPYYVENENALTKLLLAYPSSTVFDDVLIKCAVIDRFYSTNIYGNDLNKLAWHIVSIKDIDVRLRNGDLSLVNEIATCPTVSSYYLSFASKYCNWHNHRDFPIYDSIVRKILGELNKSYSLGVAKIADLRIYDVYCNALKALVQNCNLTAVMCQNSMIDFKALDRYLWVLGKMFTAKSPIINNDKATINCADGKYTIERMPNGEIKVKQRVAGATKTVAKGQIKTTLRKIAKSASRFQYDEKWNTRQFGKNLITHINTIQL